LEISSKPIHQPISGNRKGSAAEKKKIKEKFSLIGSLEKSQFFNRRQSDLHMSMNGPGAQLNNRKYNFKLFLG
jgi:hypothetical protein